MAEKVLIQGESGTGKTFSMHNMDPNTTVIVSPEKRRLPFRTPFNMLYGETDSKKIIRFMKDSVKQGAKSIIIDDFQYILAIPYMNRIHESGWDKYNDFGGNYFDILDVCKELPDDVIVYFMTHTETLDDGITRTKLIGKLLREKITVEGLFTIVLRTLVADGKYYFATQNNGKDTTKSPEGMFPTYAIENDLAYVDEKIRSYYYMDGAKSDEDMSKADEEAAAPEVEKPQPRTRKTRTATEDNKTEDRRRRTKVDDKPSEETEDKSEAEDSKGEEKTPPRRRRNRFTEAMEQAKAVAEDERDEITETVDEIAGDREEVPFDEVMDTVDKKRRRRTRND